MGRKGGRNGEREEGWGKELRRRVGEGRKKKETRREKGIEERRRRRRG